MSNKLLAKLNIADLRPETLDTFRQDAPPRTDVLNQDHYTVKYSFEDYAQRVYRAFSAWSRTRPDDDDDSYGYAWWSRSILCLYDKYIIFYCYGGQSVGYCYYKLPYTVDESDWTVTITGDPEPVAVDVVISEMTGMSQSTQEETPLPNNQTQDAVTDTGTAVTDLAAPVEHSDQNPTVPSTTTDAEITGISVPEPGTESIVSRDAEIGTAATGTAGEASAADLVTEEMDDTAAGTKQAIARIPANLIQGSPLDRRKLSLTLIEQSEKDTTTGLLRIQGIATRGDIINARNQVYQTKIWAGQLDDMNELAQAGKFLGELEHPDDEGNGLKTASIVFHKFWLQGNDLYFNATVANTSDGLNLQALMDAGATIDLSSRGYGTTKPGTWQGQSVSMIQDDFVCIAFDAVLHGASTGAGVTSAHRQSAETDATNTQTQETQLPVTTLDPQTQSRVDALVAKHTVKEVRSALLAEAAPKLSAMGQGAYAKALDNKESIVDLIQASDAILETLISAFPAPAPAEEASVQSSTYNPTFWTKQSQEEQAPKTVGEMFDRLVADLPDEPIPGFSGPKDFASPRRQCKRMMVNIANEMQGGFSGRAAALGLLALEQGKTDKAADILTQALAEGSTTASGDADPGGAPFSTAYIYPLVRRVFPMYIVNEIAAIQPLDRPQGKIFYLDAYRTDPNSGANVARIDLNTSSNPFSSSYADNSTEGAAASLIRLQLMSITVNATSKKLGAQWSIEEMQDLRAYHNLDAAAELMGSVAREMALEWNQVVLNDMLAQATAGSLTFGQVIPASGFAEQREWDEYINVYLQALDQLIFAKRNGGLTHLVAGVDASLALTKPMRGAVAFQGAEGEIFPGVTFFPAQIPGMGSIKIYRTNFWGKGTTNGEKILGLRKGTEWSDTAYVWSPYTDYVTPMLTDPADFSQKQGIVSRAAHNVVVGDAMATITVSPGATGQVL
jgi:Prohead core protein serine protease/Major capsid protein Gp23